MILEKIKNIWGINFILSCRDEYFSYLEKVLLKKEKILLTGINPYSLSIIKNNPLMLDALRITTMANVDGILLKYTLQLLGYRVPERLDTPSIFQQLLQLCVQRKLRVFFLGSKNEDLSLIKENLKKQYPEIIISGTHHGYFTKENEDSIVDKINCSDSDVIFLGMPSPKKEFFIHDNYQKMNFKISLGIGGMFDILAGKKKLAPAMVRKMKIEWLYRFLQEPRRLLVRYNDMILYFTWFVLKNLNALKKQQV